MTAPRFLMATAELQKLSFEMNKNVATPSLAETLVSLFYAWAQSCCDKRSLYGWNRNTEREQMVWIINGDSDGYSWIAAALWVKSGSWHGCGSWWSSSLMACKMQIMIDRKPKI
jgi:hypothetical protein